MLNKNKSRKDITLHMNNGWRNWFLRFQGTDEWLVGYRIIGNEQESVLAGNVDKTFKILKNSIRYWYADPIIYEKENIYYVFVEAYDRLKKRGGIAVSTLENGGALTRPRLIIDEPFHMSFPLVFDYKGETYIIPETHVINQIKVYKMGASIYEWKEYKSFDTQKQFSDTVVYIDQEIYLITTYKKSDNVFKNKLCIYKLCYLEDKEKCYLQELKVNVTDYSYRMRNGGALLNFNGKPYRVIQGMEKQTYGEDVSFRRILKCNENEYEESKDVLKINQESIEIEKKPLLLPITGMHTYGMKDGYIEVIDLRLAVVNMNGIIGYIRAVSRKIVMFWRKK